MGFMSSSITNLPSTTPYECLFIFLASGKLLLLNIFKRVYLNTETTLRISLTACKVIIKIL